MALSIQIRELADFLEFLPELEAGFRAAWAPYYGVKGPGDARRDLEESAQRDTLPIGLVAIGHGQVLGTAALKEKSVEAYPDRGPWLAALWVHPQKRNLGVEDRLMSSIEELAKTMGFGEIYAGAGDYSGMPEAVLRNRGWRMLDQKPYFVSEVRLFHKALNRE